MCVLCKSTHAILYVCVVQGTERIGMCFSSVIDSPVCIAVDLIRDLGPSCPDRPHWARRIYSLVITRSTSISLQKLQKKYNIFWGCERSGQIIVAELPGDSWSSTKHTQTHTSAYVSIRQYYGPYNVRTVRRQLSWVGALTVGALQSILPGDSWRWSSDS